MTIGQLQVIVNDLHSQIESLNEELVQLLLIRDELHTEQDAMLVDIEDLTRHAESQQKHMAEKMPAKWKEAIQPEDKLDFFFASVVVKMLLLKVAHKQTNISVSHW